MIRAGVKTLGEPGSQRGTMHSFQLHQKRAVVTGGASGIGLAIAQPFAACGADVVLIDVDPERASAAATSISESSGRPCSGVGCNVADDASVAQTFTAIGGAIDVLVNCAGIAHVGNLRNTTPEDMDRLYAVNVRGT